MKLFQSSQDRDLELLSAYIDGELSAKEQARLEQRLAADVTLRRTLAGLKRVQTTLHALPTVKPPRSFVLKPEMVGQAARQPGLTRFIPVLNFATTLAAVLFAVVIGSQLATAGQPMAAPISAQAPLAQSVPADVTTGLPETPADGTSLKSLTAPAITESAPLVMQAPGCGNSTQEPLTGGGCGGGGGGGGDTQVSPFAFSATNSTATPGPAADTSVANSAVTPEAGPTAAVGTAGESQPPVAGSAPGTGTVDQQSQDTPGPDTYSTTNGDATTAESTREAAAGPSPVTLVEYGLGALVLILIVASILVRRR